jgi:uncharacterized Zn ribbon protein
LTSLCRHCANAYVYEDGKLSYRCKKQRAKTLRMFKCRFFEEGIPTVIKKGERKCMKL